MAAPDPAFDPAACDAIGDRALLDRPLVAFVCSARLPPRLVLPAYDLACALRDAGVAVVGGFHTPVERDCLGFLLAGRQPVVVCPARGVGGMRLPTAWRAAVAAGRLLVCSPFPPDARRVTAALAEERNRFVARLAVEAVVVHAAPGGKTEAWCREFLAMGKPLRALDDPANAALFAAGAGVWREVSLTPRPSPAAAGEGRRERSPSPIAMGEGVRG